MSLKETYAIMIPNISLTSEGDNLSAIFDPKKPPSTKEPAIIAPTVQFIESAFA